MLTSPFTQINDHGSESTGNLYMKHSGRLRINYDDQDVMLVVDGGSVAMFEDVNRRTYNPYKEMVRTESMGPAPCQAKRNEASAGRPEVGCDPPLHLGQRDGLRMGERATCMTDDWPTPKLQVSRHACEVPTGWWLR